jgi:hypothetical protein
MKKKLVIFLFISMDTFLLNASWFDTIKNWFGYYTEQSSDAMDYSTLTYERQQKIIEFYTLIKNNRFDEFLAKMNKISHPDEIMLLFLRGIPNTKFGIGTTPLHIAAYYARPAFINYFIRLINSQPLFSNKQVWLNAEMNGYTALDMTMLSTFSDRTRDFRITAQERNACIDLLREVGVDHGRIYAQHVEQGGGWASMKMIKLD